MKNPARPRRLAGGFPGPEDAGDATTWGRIARAALEKDLLDGVDVSLIEALAKRAERTHDEAFRIVIACLLAAVRSGALRIPMDVQPLSDRLEAFLRALYLAPEADSPEAAAQGFAEAERLSDPAVQALETARAFDAARQAGVYNRVLRAAGDPVAAAGGTPPREAPFFPLLLWGESLYFQRHFAAEAAAGHRLAALLAAPDRPVPPDRIGTLLDTVLSRFPLRIAPVPGAADAGAGAAGVAMTFDSPQVRALEASIRKRILVVSGGPGTGKTSLAANILRLAARLGTPPSRIRMAAPTGRAAQRLSESLRRSLESIAGAFPAVAGVSPVVAGAPDGEAALDAGLAALECETLHRLLRYNPSSGEYYHQRRRPLPADLVLIDEVSMVDIFTLARLLEALPEHASLILMGDMDQLPSVEAGAVLGDLIPFGSDGARSATLLGDSLVLLDRSHRSAAGILEVTRLINAQEPERALAAMAADPDAARIGCRLIAPSGVSSGFAAGRDDCLESWVAPMREFYAGLVGELSATAPIQEPAGSGLGWKTAGPEGGHPPALAAWLEKLGAAFACLDRSRILTFTRKGWHGSEAINRRIRAMLQPDWDPWAGEGETGGFNGAPVMILENDYAKGVFNGDVGIQLRLHGRSLVVFQRPGAYLAYPARFLPRHEPAFAMTVHKSQGSEYDQVLLVLPESGNRLLYKETLYTALTRARHFAAIYGPPEVFREAVLRKVVRESGLPDYLKAMRAT